MRRSVIVASLVAFLGILAFSAYLINRHSQEQATRRQIREASRAISTVIDYSSSSGYPSADMAAREKLDTLASKDLSPEDRDTVVCMASYLGAVESVNASLSIETTRLRLGIARDAAKKMDQCMSAFDRR